MHLWPSLKVRNSFSVEYLRKLEWNLHRMKTQKQSEGNRKKLLGDEDAVDNETVAETCDSKCLSGPLSCLGEVLMIVSCCYCCFCCGACADQEEK